MNFDSFEAVLKEWDADIEQPIPRFRLSWTHSSIDQIDEIDEVRGSLGGMVGYALNPDASDEEITKYFDYSEDALAAMLIELDPFLRIERV